MQQQAALVAATTGQAAATAPYLSHMTGLPAAATQLNPAAALNGLVTPTSGTGSTQQNAAAAGLTNPSAAAAACAAAAASGCPGTQSPVSGAGGHHAAAAAAAEPLTAAAVFAATGIHPYTGRKSCHLSEYLEIKQPFSFQTKACPAVRPQRRLLYNKLIQPFRTLALAAPFPDQRAATSSSITYLKNSETRS